MAYDSTKLALADATSAVWALAWTRFMLRDTGTPEMFTDTELSAVLTATAFTAEDDDVYYRPHVAAASLIKSDPDRALSEGLLGASITNRDPSAVARAIRAAGRWVDDLIETTSEERPPTGRTLVPVF